MPALFFCAHRTGIGRHSRAEPAADLDPCQLKPENGARIGLGRVCGLASFKKAQVGALPIVGLLGVCGFSHRFPA